MHQLSLEYHCETCQVSTCPDCIILTDTHQGHQVIRLQQLVDQLEEEVTEILDKHRFQLDGLARMQERLVHLQETCQQKYTDVWNYFLMRYRLNTSMRN